MKFYEITLEGMKILLSECNQKKYADMIDSFIQEWNFEKKTENFLKAFSGKGAFKYFEFNISDFPSNCEFFWTNKLFGALVAMGTQLAHFINTGTDVNIDFIRSHFRHPTEIIKGTVCTNCGNRQISMLNVDNYISASIIADMVVSGLEHNTLNKNIKEIITLSAPEIKYERERTKIRVLNTPVPFSDEWKTRRFCLLCGGKEIKECKFLKSLKKEVFVPLGI